MRKAVAGILTVAILSAAVLAQDVTFRAHQTTLTLALWEGRTYTVHTATGKPPEFHPVSITWIKLDNVPPVVPDPDDPPVNPPVDPSSPLGKHRAAVKTATDSVTDPNKANVKKALAELYRTVAGLPVAERDQLPQATDVLFGALKLPAWAAWKTAVDKSLDKFESLDEARVAWKAVAEALAQ